MKQRRFSFIYIIEAMKKKKRQKTKKEASSSSVSFFRLVGLCVGVLCLVVIFGIRLSSNTITGINDQPRGRDDNKMKRQQQQFIIVNAGHGSTGTHLFFRATCYLGLNSVHFNLGCLSPTASPPQLMRTHMR